MSDHDETPSEDGDAYLVFLPREPIPRDVVPGRRLRREEILERNAAVGTWTAVAQSRPVFDSEGMLAGFETSEPVPVYRGTTIIPRSHLDAASLRPDDVPRLSVIDDREDQQP